MSRHLTHPRTNVCQLCELIINRQSVTRHSLRSRQLDNSTHFIVPSSRAYSQKLQKSKADSHTSKAARRSIPGLTTGLISTGDGNLDLENLRQGLQEVEAASKSILSSKGIPSEEDTVNALAKCEALAILLVLEPNTRPPLRKSRTTNRAASELLSLDDLNSTTHPPSPTSQSMQDEVSKVADSIIKHPSVFITPETLNRYVQVQSTLKRPEILPDAFNLFATKPVPEEGSYPIRYLEQSPDKVSNAIPKPIADRALQAAIDAKQLVAAMDIIEFAYAAKAFKRAKFVRKGLLPATGVAVLPFAAYTLASQLALLQTTMETGMATNVAFAGMLAYVGFTGTIGIVAVTTANDQMDRVTWAPGLPLRDRWIREEERAAVDRVAGAWGFKEKWRRGEEEGEEWDALREWVGMKGMILDRTELMEGME